MIEKKTTLPSLRNQNRKKVKVKKSKGKQIINKYPGNITELN